MLTKVIRTNAVGGGEPGFREIEASVRTMHWTEAWRLKRELRVILRNDGFTKTPLLNRHRKDGVFVRYGIKFEDPSGDCFFEFKLRTETPSKETDDLIKRLRETVGLDKN